MGRTGARPWQCNKAGRWVWSQASWCPQAGEDSDKPAGMTTAWEHVRGCSCGRTPWGRWRAPDRVPAHTELRGVTEGWGGAGLRWGIGETWLREAGRWQGQGRRVTERQTNLPSSPARVNTDKKRTPVYFFLANHWYVSTPLFILNFPIHYPPP